MCGIAGIVASGRLHADDRDRLTRMRDVLAHRGPDDAGVYGDDQALLGHRRLSIVDVAAGHQPLSNEDETAWIVFNGEIYNHAEVRTGLEAAGHRYRTRCDTETIVHAYEQWGDACVEQLRGMFAFAIWDAPRRRLLLARDRLGVKPLYWTVADGRLLFGSEIKAILKSGLVRAEANEAALPELLGTRYLSGTETLFRGIHRLQPGHTLVYQDGAVSIRQYWDIPAGRASGETAPLSDREAVGRFRELLEESVRIRLMADVPLGMFLSGGLDSSAIAALMARMIDRPLQTFSVAFEAAGVQRARVRAPGRDRDRRRVARDRHRRSGLLRRAAAAGLARGRTDRPSVERPAVLRLGAGPRARQGRPDRRRQRRTAGRLRRNIRRRSSTGAPRRPTAPCRRRCGSGWPTHSSRACPAGWAGSRAGPFWRCRERRKRCSSTTSRRSGCAARRRC